MRDEKEKKDKDERIEVVLPDIEGTELVRPTDDVMELLDMYKFVRGKQVEPQRKPLSDDELERLIRFDAQMRLSRMPDSEARQFMLRMEELAVAEGLREPVPGRVADATQRELDRVQLEVDSE